MSRTGYIIYAAVATVVATMFNYVSLSPSSDGNCMHSGGYCGGGNYSGDSDYSGGHK